MRLRALTLRPPWGNLVVQGLKPVENRSTNVIGNYRGPLVVHNGRKVDERGFSEARRIAGVRMDPGRLYCGHVVGLVNLVDVHQWPCSCTSMWAETGTVPVRSGDSWTNSGIWHLILTRPTPLKPFLATGQQGVWYLTAEQTARVCDELGMVCDG